MPLGTFLAYTVIGSLLWNSGLIGAGYVLGEEHRWKQIETVMGYVQYVVVLGIFAAVGWFVWNRFLGGGGRGRPDASDSDADRSDRPVTSGDRHDG